MYSPVRLEIQICVHCLEIRSRQYGTNIKTDIAKLTEQNLLTVKLALYLFSPYEGNFSQKFVHLPCFNNEALLFQTLWWCPLNNYAGRGPSLKMVSVLLLLLLLLLLLGGWREGGRAFEIAQYSPYYVIVLYA